MRKIIATMLIFTLFLGTSSIAYANEDLIQSMGIIEGDEFGNLHLGSNVTRAEFCKMLTAASEFKDESLPYSASLFSDVKSNHWANSYIKICVENNWVTGYTDGSFRPDNAMRAEEAYMMSLKLLDYDLTTLHGNSKIAVMNLANSVGLTKNISNTGVFTRGDCVSLFTNILNAKTASGVYYAETLGYKMSDGALDTSSVAEDALEGPYVYNGNLSISDNMTIYINDAVSSAQYLSLNDVYYISEPTNAMYVYTHKIYGTITEINDNLTAPTSVVVNGVSYTLGTNEAKSILSLNGSIKTGEMVTLLLGMNGDVVDIIDDIGSEISYYGVITSVQLNSIGANVTVDCTDGVSHIFETTQTSFESGDVIEVKINDKIELHPIGNGGLTGTVSKGELDGIDFAENIEIIDVYENTSKRVYASELEGKTFASNDILYYNLDNNGTITHMILNNATGDLMAYGYLNDVKKMSQNLSLSGTYDLYIDGKNSVLKTNNILYSVNIGGVSISYDNGTIDDLSNLDEVKIADIYGTIANVNNDDIMIAGNAEIYYYSEGTYISMELSDLDTDVYDLVGYIDDCSVGGKIRVIIAS